MIKIIIFFVLSLIVLLLIKKLVVTFSKKISTQYISYLIMILLFIMFIFIYRENTLENSKGKYEPPKFDGETVIPGKVISE